LKTFVERGKAEIKHGSYHPTSYVAYMCPQASAKRTHQAFAAPSLTSSSCHLVPPCPQKAATITLARLIYSHSICGVRSLSHLVCSHLH
jgi:hypothetical protein